MVCPNCGYCPHCGRGGYHTYPFLPYGQIQIPLWKNGESNTIGVADQMAGYAGTYPPYLNKETDLPNRPERATAII